VVRFSPDAQYAFTTDEGIYKIQPGGYTRIRFIRLPPWDTVDISPAWKTIVAQDYSNSSTFIDVASNLTMSTFSDSLRVAQFVWSPDDSRLAFRTYEGVSGVLESGSNRSAVCQPDLMTIKRGTLVSGGLKELGVYDEIPMTLDGKDEGTNASIEVDVYSKSPF